MPARALWNTSVECADVAGRRRARAVGTAPVPAGWADRFAVCDEVLTRLAGPRRRRWPGARPRGGRWSDPAGRRRSASWPPTSAGAASTWPGGSATSSGSDPKLAARVVRFERARHMLQATPSFVTIAQVAAACGYYDQAHLDRDFAELAGCSPPAWLAEEVPSVQDDDVLVV